MHRRPHHPHHCSHYVDTQEGAYPLTAPQPPQAATQGRIRLRSSYSHAHAVAVPAHPDLGAVPHPLPCVKVKLGNTSRALRSSTGHHG